MFTGLVDHCGKIVAVNRLAAETTELIIASAFTDLALGESIAVDGACLTVTAIEGEHFNCELSAETNQCTRSSCYQAGDSVNLERALRLSDRLGGHIVTGHVDQIATLLTKTAQQEFILMRFAGVKDPAKPWLVPKGSVAVNGVSLTVNTTHEDEFTVMLIPHTLAKTNLAELAEGDSVNLEFDWLAKQISQQLSKYRGAYEQDPCNH